MSYDPNNIFAKILRGEIPAKKIYEDELVLAFHDIHPKKKVHVLVIPKSPYTDIQSFGEDANDEEIVALFRAVPKIAHQLGISNSGYRVITNCKAHGGQEVPHLHLHILGGEAVGHLVS